MHLAAPILQSELSKLKKSQTDRPDTLVGACLQKHSVSQKFGLSSHVKSIENDLINNQYKSQTQNIDVLQQLMLSYHTYCYIMNQQSLLSS